MANANFGRTVPTATPDPDWVTGWGKRGYNWQFALAVDRQLTDGLSVTAGYYRTWYGNQIVVDNLLVGPAGLRPVLRHRPRRCAARRRAASRSAGSTTSTRARSARSISS